MPFPESFVSEAIPGNLRRPPCAKSRFESNSCEGMPQLFALSSPAKCCRRLSLPVAGLLEGATTFGNRVRVDQWELRRAVTRSLYTELAHPVAKRVRMKVQDPRRALWTVNHSRGLLKGRHDMVSFYLVQR